MVNLFVHGKEQGEGKWQTPLSNTKRKEIKEGEENA